MLFIRKTCDLSVYDANTQNLKQGKRYHGVRHQISFAQLKTVNGKVENQYLKYIGKL